ncbi:SEC-C metal-binding domain-containing protein [Desulfosporosinus sp. FKB]|uniref:SEC-C metal-binding domain-containing protein n=1 Tax=Desulfosporosinus sp. FKB TaxID=1969835 RepID=UPI00249E3367|nr:SEC-C metal-binding domain-containing protein [Desulfosporosinus sp. FKB]
MSNVGRNESCPCGSGKKYKHCCLNKPESDKFATWKVNALEILANEPQRDSILAVFFTTLEYIERKNWAGACHAVSSVLYVLLSEIGLSPTLCVGEVRGDRGFFDHSWVEVEDKIFDVSVYKNLDYGMMFAPVIKGYDIDTKEQTKGIYGIKFEGLDPTAQMLTNIPFNSYMSGFPDNKNGLWGVIKDLGNEMSLDFDLEQLKEKYSQTKWVYKVN